MDSRVASRVESGLSRPRTAAGPNSRRVCRDVQDALGGRGISHAPLWHDGPERPIHRPADPEAQQEYDRGTKKCHTRKTLLVIHEPWHVCFLSHTCEGKAADKSLAELAGSTVPPGSCLYQEKGFQGFVLPGITLLQPTKTPRGGELTPPEKAAHRRLASIRIRIEHARGGGKR